MAVGAFRDIRDEAEKARQAIPEKYLPPVGATLLSTFDKQQMDKAGMTADRDGYMNPQELRNLAARLAKTETEEEFREALAGVSTRLMAIFLKYREEAIEKARKEDRKAREDAYYMALLQAQIDDLNRQIDELEGAQDYLNRTGDVRGTIKLPGIKDAVEKWESQTGQKFDPDADNAQATLNKILADRIQASKTKLQDYVEAKENLSAEVAALDNVASKNSAQLSGVAKSIVTSNTAEGVEEVRSNLKERSAKEALDNAQDFNASTREALNTIRDQLAHEEAQLSNVSLHTVNELNEQKTTLPDIRVSVGNGTVSVASSLDDPSIATLRIRPQFAEVSSNKEGTLQELLVNLEITTNIIKDSEIQTKENEFQLESKPEGIKLG